MSSDSRLVSQIVPSDEYVLHDLGSENTQSSCNFSHGKPNRDAKTCITRQKEEVCTTVHSKAVIRPCYNNYNNCETVVEANNYQKLQTYVRSEAHQFQHSSVLQRDGAPPRTIRYVCSLLERGVSRFLD